jgi:hypothetical protein
MDEDDVLEEIVADHHARRELLWLRATEKGDEDAARDLERVDPELVARLRRAGLEVDECGEESARARAELFARLWDRCHARHLASFRRSWPPGLRLDGTAAMVERRRDERGDREKARS